MIYVIPYYSARVYLANKFRVENKAFQCFRPNNHVGPVYVWSGYAAVFDCPRALGRLRALKARAAVAAGREVAMFTIRDLHLEIASR